METKIEARAKAAEIAASLSGDFKTNFDIIYSAILGNAQIPEIPQNQEIMGEVARILKTILNEYGEKNV